MMKNTMQALVYEGPRELNMRMLPVPEPAVGEVLIKVSYAGICGSELSGYLGQNSLRVPPLVMGHEFTGSVVSIGEGVTGLAPGTRVTVNPLIHCGSCPRCRESRVQLCERRQLIGAHRPGSFAEYVAVPAGSVVRLPEALTMEQGVLAEPLACAVHIGRLASMNPGDRLLVCGAGPIGILVMMTAQALGLRDIVVMDLNAQRLRIVEALGGIAVSTREQLRWAAPESGFDLTVDAVGVDATRQQAVELTRAGGKVVFSGLHDANSIIPVNIAVRNELVLLGAFCYNPGDFEQAVEWLRIGRIRLDDYVEVCPLEEGQSCFERLIRNPGRTTKIILRAADE